MNRQQVYNSLFADDYIEEIREHGEKLSKSCWGLGYLAVDAIDHLQRLKSKIVRCETSHSAEFCDYVMSMTDGDLLYCIAQTAGIGFYRLQDFYYVVRFFDMGTINKYGDILPFSYFEFARSTGNDNAIAVLERAESEFHKRGGKNCGLDWLKMQFYNAAGDPGVSDDNQVVTEFDDAAAHYYDDNDFVVVASEENNPGRSEPLRAPIWYLITGAGKVFLRLRKNIEDADIDQGKRKKFLDTIDLILSMVEDLKVEFCEKESDD